MTGQKTEIRAIICAGGLGTRVWPASTVTNKHLLWVGPSLPMITFPMLTLQRIGIKEVCLITGQGHSGDFDRYPGNGEFCYRDKNLSNLIDLSVTYRIQTKPGGIAQAILLGEKSVDGRPSLTILGDNILLGSITESVNKFKKNPSRARVLIHQVPDPKPYGVVEFDKDSRIIDIIEKPQSPPSDYIVIGIYMYPPDVFDIIRGLKPSTRGELEITDVNKEYLRQGRLEYDIFTGIWIDAGEHEWSLFEAGIILARNWAQVVKIYPSLQKIPEFPENIL